MTTFAERMGFRQARKLIQKDELDEQTRIALWNDVVVLKEVFDEIINRRYSSDETEDRLLESVWANFYNRASDEKPHNTHVWAAIKSTIIDDNWYDSLSIIEFLMERLELRSSESFQNIHTSAIEAINRTFEKNLVGYRFIDTHITPIDTDAELDAIQSALDETDHLAGVRHSLQRAVELFADRKQPDYPNSIKESISAVEAIVKKITGKGTLGEGIKKLESSGLKIHPALKDAWLKMYGWTSDADGIRHAGIEAADANQALAKYALISCSAFISYLLDEGQKAGLLDTVDSPA